MTVTAYTQLREAILNGDLPPGQRLLPAELQAIFGFGLTPIREALLRLNAEGLVTSPAGRGARVSEFGLPEMHDIMQARRSIEQACLASAIANGHAAWEDEIVRTYHMLSATPYAGASDAADGLEAWEQSHRKFHDALVAACTSEWLLHFRNILVDQSFRYRRIIQQQYLSASANREIYDQHHADMMQATIERDKDRAVALMDQHMAAIEEDLARCITELTARSETTDTHTA